MSAGDRGGVQDLIKTIAKSKARLQLSGSLWPN